MNLAEYLDLLCISPNEFVGMLWKRGPDKHAAVMPRNVVGAIAEHEIPRSFDAYLAPNPTAGPIRMDTRGTEEQVTRVAALYADLDVKPGACTDLDAAHRIVDDLSGLLAERPGAIIFSGGGLQPIWLLADCDPITGRALLRRFGRLVRVVGQTRNAHLDNISDAARVLRIPGTLNHKYGIPIEVLIVPDTGAAMDPTTVGEKLDEAGIFAEEDDTEIGRPDVMAAESTWIPGIQTCGYAAKTTESWLTEPVDARHPWYLKNSIRLECMRRNSCFTTDRYMAAAKALEDRFKALLDSQEPKRQPARYEIRDIRNEGIDRASRKTSEQLNTELGSSDGTGHVHLVSPVPSPSVAPDQVPTTAEIAPRDDLENGFWVARESLSTIYTAALSRMCSPWAVLACCVARALALVRPNCVLPALVGGGRGSLNWFGAVVAQSGGGKGSSLSLAQELVKEFVYQRNLGSGEGMVTAYVTRTNDETPYGTRESVMFVADEVDNVTALGARTGSTLMATLRSAFTGATLGFSYAGRGKNIHLEAHTYRLTLICAMQPGRSAPILTDDAGGTPQRFMWFPGIDRRITRELADEYRWMPFGLTLPSLNEWTYPHEIILPGAAESYVLDQRVRAVNGDADPLDGHAIFAREKFAYALAVLDGRVTMTLEDWELSGIAAEVSRHTRDWVLSQMAVTVRRDAERRGEIRGFESGAADDTKLAVAAERSDRIARWALAKLRAVNGDGMTNRDLRNAAASRDRPYLDAILGYLVSQGRVGAQPGPQGGNIWRAT